MQEIFQGATRMNSCGFSIHEHHKTKDDVQHTYYLVIIFNNNFILKFNLLYAEQIRKILTETHFLEKKGSAEHHDYLRERIK